MRNAFILYKSNKNVWKSDSCIKQYLQGGGMLGDIKTTVMVL